MWHNWAGSVGRRSSPTGFDSEIRNGALQSPSGGRTPSAYVVAAGRTLWAGAVPRQDLTVRFAFMFRRSQYS
eukprot:7242361-Alexandrium_andersonii.AAC.1